MIVWIPTKQEIERSFEIMLDKLRASDNVSDLELWLDDELNEMECHISNRAGVERKEVTDSRY